MRYFGVFKRFFCVLQVLFGSIIVDLDHLQVLSANDEFHCSPPGSAAYVKSKLDIFV